MTLTDLFRPADFVSVFLFPWQSFAHARSASSATFPRQTDANLGSAITYIIKNIKKNNKYIRDGSLGRSLFFVSRPDLLEVLFEIDFLRTKNAKKGKTRGTGKRSAGRKQSFQRFPKYHARLFVITPWRSITLYFAFWRALICFGVTGHLRKTNAAERVIEGLRAISGILSKPQTWKKGYSEEMG